MVKFIVTRMVIWHSKRRRWSLFTIIVVGSSVLLVMRETFYHRPWLRVARRNEMIVFVLGVTQILVGMLYWGVGQNYIWEIFDCLVLILVCCQCAVPLETTDKHKNITICYSEWDYFYIVVVSYYRYFRDGFKNIFRCLIK